MMARDLISRRLDMPEDSFAVEITSEIGAPAGAAKRVSVVLLGVGFR
jgi:hypothetical protein